ncbi:hypothetical protein LCGC14_0422670 [marine sediment metagenome]|uniref:DUF4346 domain-containing protein n=1 Tax=marine sediment metagenome TaxID=412755 RepID=A0A0F9SWD8_9ZZZZ
MWQLIKVPKTDWIKDNSGYYTLINWIDDNTVRLDVMGIADSINPTDYPVISYQGAASDVRKRMMQDWPILLQPEHAAYIGAELARCELLKTDYVQD